MFRYPKAEFYIYTGDVEATGIEILQKVEQTLNVKLEKNVKFIYLHRRKWVESSMYPYLTLLGQSLGSVFLGYEALCQLNPGNIFNFCTTTVICSLKYSSLILDIFLETTGFTFTLPLFKYLGGCQTGSYIHYPIITNDMLKRVSSRQSMYNNRGIIARSPVLTMAKLLYYNVFAWVSICY